MSSEKIILPDFLIADFYKNALVELDTYAPSHANSQKENDPLPIENKPSKDQAIKYLGDNGKNVIVILNQPKHVHIDENDLNFLTNILKACALTLSDIAIINIAKQTVSYNQIHDQLNGICLLLFKVQPSDIKLPFQIPVFQIQKYNISAILTAPALSEINNSSQEGRLLKTKLWVSLKQLFGIS